MKATNRLDILINDPSITTNRILHQTSLDPLPRLTLSEHDSYPSSRLPSVIPTTVPLPPRRDCSSMKTHRRRHQNQLDSNDKQKQSTTPLLNSSTLDDLFRALTLECEQYLAATSSSYQNKTYGQILVQPSSINNNIRKGNESNDEDYENLHPPKSSQPVVNHVSPLKTSIEVISPIKRHVVSITVSSKISSPIKTSTITTKSLRQSSEDDSNSKSSSIINRKNHRRRRARKQYLSSITPTSRSSSSSNERNDNNNNNNNSIDKKSIISKRSSSTDPRFQRPKTAYDNNFLSTSSTQKSFQKRPRRRDISLQHNLSNSERYYENYRPPPLSLLLTSTNKQQTSDFLDPSQSIRQQRRSRLESVNQKSSKLIDRMHQQFYRPTPTQHTTTTTTTNNNKNNNNILTHRIPSYPVY